MHAMQYEITLPADYDMAIIRHRVATRGSMTDGFDGLGLKAYAIRERGVDGSPVNQYAPFYLWASGRRDEQLPLGRPVRRVVARLRPPGRAAVDGTCLRRGPAYATTPRAAARRTQRIAADADATDAIEAAVTETREVARDNGVHSVALAIDTRGWELARFTLWAALAAQQGVAAGEGEAAYQVLHLSSPHIDDLEVRPW